MDKKEQVGCCDIGDPHTNLENPVGPSFIIYNIVIYMDV